VTNSLYVCSILVSRFVFPLVHWHYWLGDWGRASGL